MAGTEAVTAKVVYLGLNLKRSIQGLELSKLRITSSNTTSNTSLTDLYSCSEVKDFEGSKSAAQH